MKRRTFLSGSGCAVMVVIAGCIDDASDDDSTGGESSRQDDESDNSTETSNEEEPGESYYELEISAPEDSPGEFDYCEFETLPVGAQTEFENAVTNAEFETEETITYRLDDDPGILETDCYGQYIKFQGEYYKLHVIAAGG